jgi:putative two-component system response regulator
MMSRKTIFLVDDNATSLAAGKSQLRSSYRVYPIPSAEILFKLFENIQPDIILLDVEMPGMDGYEVIKRLKANQRWAEIPVIFLSSKSDEESELRGLSLGAIDYVTKPFSAPLLLKRIENHLLTAAQKRELKLLNDNLEDLVYKKAMQVFNLQTTVLSAVADLVEFRDNVTGGHAARTQRYLKLLVDQLLEEGAYLEEMSLWNMEYLLPSAQLHDLGKIGISDIVLNKPDKLTHAEYEIIKQHVEIGVRAIEKIESNAAEHSFLHHARLIAGGHHEKWDGSGYPVGLMGAAIPLEGRLMAIADVYDALISRRPYKRPYSTEEANRIIVDGSGTHFDPLLVHIFIKVSGQFEHIVKTYANGC